MADLFANGNPHRRPLECRVGLYQHRSGRLARLASYWHPGNPNFHTDKYMGAIYIAAALRDHPHSDMWLQFGYDNYLQDLEKVFRPPHGVGFECPATLATQWASSSRSKIFYNLGFGNAPAENPAFAGSGRWHRHLMTPYDRRIERRHEAPIGDTHRWDAGLGLGFVKLALFFKEEDPAFASEMMGMWQMLVDQGMGKKDRLRGMLMDVDPSIPAMDPMEMDWSAQTWFGFGSIMRTGYGTDQETFLFKAGPSRGHGHNEELSYHYYSDNTPISLDYNCSYTPRGDRSPAQLDDLWQRRHRPPQWPSVRIGTKARKERDVLRGVAERSSEQARCKPSFSALHTSRKIPRCHRWSKLALPVILARSQADASQMWCALNALDRGYRIVQSNHRMLNSAVVTRIVMLASWFTAVGLRW